MDSNVIITRLAVAAALVGLLASPLRTQAAAKPVTVTPVGARIDNAVTLTYGSDSPGQVRTCASNVASFTVGQSAGVSLTPATAAQNTTPGKPVYFALALTNTGNGPDTLSVSVSVPSGWSAALLKDDNGDGAHQNGETTSLPANPALAAGQSQAAFLAVTPPAKLGQAATVTATVRLTSQADPSKSAQAAATVTCAASPPPMGTGPTSTGTTVPTGKANLYRLDYGQYQYLTTDGNEYMTLTAMGWVQRGATGQVYTDATKAPGLIPLYQLYNPSTGDHFYTANEAEKNAFAQAYSVQGVAGYVFPSDGPGRTPMYRAYNQASGQHLFTSDRAEYDALPGDWTREGVAAYVLPVQVPLYRLGNGISHILTANQSEYNSLIAAGWTSEGIAGNVYIDASDMPGLVPLYRIYRASLKDHFYTVNEKEKNAVCVTSTFEGVAGYVFPSDGPGRTPMYRAYNRSNCQHLFTSSQSEFLALPAPWTQEGIGWLMP